MNDLASTVSNILNDASQGVGDISQWLASNGLPEYAKIEAISSGISTFIMIGLLIFLVLLYKRSMRLIKILLSPEDEVLTMVVLGVVTVISLVIGAFVLYCLYMNCISFIGWMAAPDGMLVKVLTSSLTNGQ